MPAKNHKQWFANSPLQLGELVDSRVYSGPRIQFEIVNGLPG
jgi:hypothetical protein